jgi:hypothetical protein
MGEFEDRWEDEIEEEVVDGDAMAEDEDGQGDGECWYGGELGQLASP